LKPLQDEALKMLGAFLHDAALKPCKQVKALAGDDEALKPCKQVKALADDDAALKPLKMLGAFIQDEALKMMKP